MPYKCFLFNYLLTFFIFTDFAMIGIFFLLNPTTLIRQSAFFIRWSFPPRILPWRMMTFLIVLLLDCYLRIYFYSFLLPLFKKHKEFIVQKDNLEISRNHTLESFKGSFSAYPESLAGLLNKYPFHRLITPCIFSLVCSLSVEATKKKKKSKRKESTL